MQAVVGGNVRYPNLTEIADLFRSLINDTANSTTGSGTGSGNAAGIIMGNSNPDLVTLLRSGIRTLYSDLRNVGDPELVLDNYILTGLPALTQPDPTVQVGLGYAGFFDGYQWHPQWTLPIALSKLLGVWERETNSNEDFAPLSPAPFGLPGVQQGRRMCRWEMREGILWMPGATNSVDLRIRCRISYPSNFNTANLNYDTTYVPILNCADAVVAKMLKRYAIRFAPEMLAAATQMETEEMAKLRLEIVRGQQLIENQRAEFGSEAVADFAVAFSWL